MINKEDKIKLTYTEKKILDLVCKGLSDREIAEAMGLNSKYNKNACQKHSLEE